MREMNLLILDNFLYILVVLFLYLIYSLIEKTSFKKNKTYFDIVSGLVLGLICLFVVAISNILIFDKPNFEKFQQGVYLFPLSIFMVWGIYKSQICGLIIGGINLFTLLFMRMYFVDFFPQIFDKPFLYFLITIYLLFCIGLFTIIFYSPIKPWTLLIGLTVIFGIYLLILLISTLKIKYNEFQPYYIIVWLSFNFFLFCIIELINNIYENTKHLHNLVTYDNTFYLGANYANEYLINFLQTKKIKYGIYLNFIIADYKIFEKSVDPSIRDSILKNITSQVYINFINYSSNTVFFKVDYKTYGIFIPIKKNNISNKVDEIINNELANINEIWKKIKTNFKYGNYLININLKSSVLFFGLDSNNLETLKFLCTQNLLNEQLLKTNVINLVNSKQILDNASIKNKLFQISTRIDLDKFDIQYSLIYSSEDQKILGYMINYYQDSYELTDEYLNKQIKNEELVCIFIRYASLKVLTYVGKDNTFNKKIFIKYNSLALDLDSFDPLKFQMKLIENGINIKDIYFGFSMDDKYVFRNNHKKNLNKLKKLGINFYLYDCGDLNDNYEIIFKYEPKYVFLKKDIIKKIIINDNYLEIINRLNSILEKCGSHLVATSIDKINTYYKLKKINVKLFQGKLIGTSSIPIEASDSLKYLLSKNDKM